MAPVRRTRALAAMVGGVVILTLAACVAGRARSAPPAPTAGADSVPVGYGSQPRRDVTGAVGTVSGARIDNERVTMVEQLLQGRLAGVQVLPLPDGGFTIRVRNATSILGDAEPLFVVDGMPLPRGGPPGTALRGLDPQDIARIDVLKDAAAAALYGSEGANGVVIITTRRR